MDYYPRDRTDHIAKVMRLDPRKEWLASKLYSESYSYCSCREDHTINPPCGSVKKARAKVEMLINEALDIGLVTGINSYEIPPEPKYKWEEDTLEGIASMDDMDYAEFIRKMDQEELDAFINWRREKKYGRKGHADQLRQEASVPYVVRSCLEGSTGRMS